MTRVTHASTRWTIGQGSPLAVIAGCNVLESLEESLAMGRVLKSVCADLNLPYVFKASFDKANRSSITSFRGPGLEKGLEMLSTIKAELNVPICTDVHTADQAMAVAEVAEIIQLPAFLCRQTDLVTAMAEAAKAKGSLIHVKKAQFLAPWDCKNILSKIRETYSANQIILCERGTSFGYNNLVVDPLSISEMRKLGVPVTIDATHAVQLPGADPRSGGTSTGGRRDGVAIIAKAAVAAGADGVFLEFHTDPNSALCDAPSCLPISEARPLLTQLKALREIVSENASDA
ncbi:2-dehydro-3-deoxyphosphooctonate aldolase (KDO 8-P synthase) [Litorimonas taeanensis]|uniref:3-deoxy-8-phosphooctulonate synthase n=1 Tax=Litorimonas taeanensis TaxID=568099 RepID=A0A420WDU6_9PROT|nr:3-deoxy-8-phosphooctulonate synthase [Litorimonas taeanensis]RKQ69204.1 2-dehydro-3-deoxyphosphooctonate aldolase (KDO 8-P synthase) [Litorimonas taeanensis]